MLPSHQPKRPAAPTTSMPHTSPPLEQRAHNRNPAVCHPVFFTGRLRKAPNGGTGGVNAKGMNPAATGYVYPVGVTKL
ncbi:hypothetical protein C7212DRAFT_317614 [Tuber magnatum]|uniref:Uncharacterized protein n=1 Tax=Tuber magnatum TaxID=42249 RepID=A0A317SPF6_9PEZI|nr:hypothetical protein C7212DRAFT_317614 [Tuber magnatum]